MEQEEEEREEEDLRYLNKMMPLRREIGEPERSFRRRKKVRRGQRERSKVFSSPRKELFSLLSSSIFHSEEKRISSSLSSTSSSSSFSHSLSLPPSPSLFSPCSSSSSSSTSLPSSLCPFSPSPSLRASLSSSFSPPFFCQGVSRPFLEEEEREEVRPHPQESSSCLCRLLSSSFERSLHFSSTWVISSKIPFNLKQIRDAHSRGVCTPRRFSSSSASSSSSCGGEQEKDQVKRRGEEEEQGQHSSSLLNSSSLSFSPSSSSFLPRHQSLSVSLEEGQGGVAFSSSSFLSSSSSSPSLTLVCPFSLSLRRTNDSSSLSSSSLSLLKPSRSSLTFSFLVMSPSSRSSALLIFFSPPSSSPPFLLFSPPHAPTEPNASALKQEKEKREKEKEEERRRRKEEDRGDEEEEGEQTLLKISRFGSLASQVPFFSFSSCEGGRSILPLLFPSFAYSSSVDRERQVEKQKSCLHDDRNDLSMIEEEKEKMTKPEGKESLSSSFLCSSVSSVFSSLRESIYHILSSKFLQSFSLQERERRKEPARREKKRIYLKDEEEKKKEREEEKREEEKDLEGKESPMRRRDRSLSSSSSSFLLKRERSFLLSKRRRRFFFFSSSCSFLSLALFLSVLFFSFLSTRTAWRREKCDEEEGKIGEKLEQHVGRRAGVWQGQSDGSSFFYLEKGEERKEREEEERNYFLMKNVFLLVNADEERSGRRIEGAAALSSLSSFSSVLSERGGDEEEEEKKKKIEESPGDRAQKRRLFSLFGSKDKKNEEEKEKKKQEEKKTEEGQKKEDAEETKKKKEEDEEEEKKKKEEEERKKEEEENKKKEEQKKKKDEEEGKKKEEGEESKKGDDGDKSKKEDKGEKSEKEEKEKEEEKSKKEEEKKKRADPESEKERSQQESAREEREEEKERKKVGEKESVSSSSSSAGDQSEKKEKEQDQVKTEPSSPSPQSSSGKEEEKGGNKKNEKKEEEENLPRENEDEKSSSGSEKKGKEEKVEKEEEANKGEKKDEDDEKKKKNEGEKEERNSSPSSSSSTGGVDASQTGKKEGAEQQGENKKEEEKKKKEGEEEDGNLSSSSSSATTPPAVSIVPAVLHQGNEKDGTPVTFLAIPLEALAPNSSSSSSLVTLPSSAVVGVHTNPSSDHDASSSPSSSSSSSSFLSPSSTRGEEDASSLKGQDHKEGDKKEAQATEEKKGGITQGFALDPHDKKEEREDKKERGDKEDGKERLVDGKEEEKKQVTTPVQEKDLGRKTVHVALPFPLSSGSHESSTGATLGRLIELSSLRGDSYAIPSFLFHEKTSSSSSSFQDTDSSLASPKKQLQEHKGGALHLPSQSTSSSSSSLLLGEDGNPSLEALTSNEREMVLSTGLLTLLTVLALSLILTHLISKKCRCKWLQMPVCATLLGLIVGAVLKLGLRVEGPILGSVLAMNEDVFFVMLLPPIIFEGGLGLSEGSLSRPFMKNFGAIIWLAGFCTVVSFCWVGCLMFFGGVLKLSMCLTVRQAFAFGALISSTDPVSVLSLFKELHAKKTIHVLVFGESLLNDAISIVLYRTIVSHETASVGSAILSFFLTFFISLTIGLAIGLLCALIYRYMDLHMEENQILESALLLLFPWMSYLIADGLGYSGIVAICFCGVSVGKYAMPNLSLSAQATSRSVFNSFSLLAETVVFVFLGLAVFTFDTHYEGEDFSSIGLYALGFIATFTARGVSVYVTCCLINFFRNSSRITSNQQIALILCGLRGAIAFALSERARRDFGGREGAALLSLTLYLALFTILVVGPSLVYFLDRLGIFEKHRGEGGEYEEVKERGRRGHRHYDQRGGSSSFHPPENSLEALASLPSRSTTATSLITTTTTGGVRRKKGGALVVEEEESCRQLYGRSRACGGAEGSSRYRGEARYDLSVLQGRQERGGVGSRNVLMREEEEEEEGGEKGYTRRRDPIIRPGNANQDAHDEEDDIHDEEEEEESLEAVTRGTCGGLKRLLIQIDRRFMIPVFTHHRPFYRHSRSVSLHAPPPRVPLPPFSSSHRSFVWWSPVRRRLSFLFHSSSPPTSLQPPQRERERFTGSNAARRPRGGKEEEQENLSSSSSSSSGGKMTGRLSSVLFKTKSSGEEREEMTGVTITGKPSMRFAMKDRRFLIANRRFDSDSSSPPPTAPSHETSASHRRWLATLSTGSTSSNATHGVAENTNLARKKNALSSSSDATSTPPSISGPYKKKKRSLYDRGDGPRADRVSTRSSTRYIRMVPTSSSSFRQEEEEEEERRERRTGRGVAGGLSWAGLRRSLGVVVRTQEEEEEELERLSEVFEDDFDEEEEEEEEEEERRTVSYASSSSSRQEQQGREREEEEEGVKKIEEDLRRGEEVKVEDERGEKVRDLGEGIEMMRNHTNHHYHEEEEEFNGERKKRSVDVSHDDGDSSSSSLAWNGVDPSYHGGKKDPMKIAGHSVKEKKNALLPLHPSHSRNPPGADQQEEEEERDDERENREEKIDLLQEEEDEGDAFDKLDGDLNESKKKKNGIPMIMVSSHDKKASSFTPPATTGPLNHLNNAVCHEDDSSIHPFVPCPLPAEVTPLNRSSQMSSTLHHPQPLPVLVGRRRSIDKKIGGEEEEEEQEERRRMIKNKGRDGEMNGVH